MNSPSDNPEPVKSKQNNVTSSLSRYSIKGKASNLHPELPCKYTIQLSFYCVLSAGIKWDASIHFPYLLNNFLSKRITSKSSSKNILLSPKSSLLYN